MSKQNDRLHNALEAAGITIPTIMTVYRDNESEVRRLPSYEASI